MSPRNPPCSETTVVPIQMDSVPVSNKPGMHETNHELPPEEGQLFEKHVQKVCSDRDLRPWEDAGWSATFQVDLSFFFFPSS